MTPRYRFVARPSDIVHGHPFLVFDAQDRLHVPLTAFAKEAGTRLSQGSVRAYLYGILPFFSYLDTDEWQVRLGTKWDSSADQVRQAVHDYLVQRLACKLKRHELGFQLVSLTADSQSTLGVFLAGLKLFYRVMAATKRYSHENPLVDIKPVTDVDWTAAGDAFPRMPDASGVVTPQPRQRLSDSYFKLEGEDWVPQVVDDATLPARVIEGGRRLKRWRLREECVTRLLFETGGRVSEVTGLTLGDWVGRGLLQEVSAFSKGSHGRKVKFLRFSNDTAKLLRRYVNGDRKKLDPDGNSLDDFIRLADRRLVDLTAVPLFLSARGTALTPKSYREHYWKPACRAAGIDADVHQARHWYVTMAVRQIYETAKEEGEVQRRLRELIEYMKWRAGWQTMAAYEHYFDAARHADIQDQLHAHLNRLLETGLKRRQSSTQPALRDRTGADAAEPSGNAEYEYLVGFGGNVASG